MLVSRPATMEELPAAYEYVDAILGPGITPYSFVQEMQAKNDLFINIITDTDAPAKLSDIFGYFSLIPLTAEAHQTIKTKVLWGRDIGPSHMPPKGERPSALYIGAVASRLKKPETLRAMFRKIDETCLPLYARPATTDGFDLCKRLGFKPLQQVPNSEGYQMFAMRAPLMSRK